MAKQTKMDIVKAFLLAHPRITSNKKLGVLLHNKYPLLFKDAENARGFVRVAMGTKGVQLKYKELGSFLDRLKNAREEFKLEVEKPQDMTPYVLSPNYKKVLIISDTHNPYVDIDALDLALEYGYKNGVDSIIINGDFEDFSSISKFLTKPTAPRALEILEESIRLLDYIQYSLGVKVILHEGNHTLRWEHYLIRQAPEFWELPAIQLENLYKCREKGIDYVHNHKFMKVGKLSVTHGNHIVRGIFAPVNAARGVFVKTNANVMIGHVHKTSEHIESDLHGNVIGCFSTGCLTTIQPEYNPQTSKYNQGFAMVEVIGDKGEFVVSNKKIINYKIY